MERDGNGPKRKRAPESGARCVLMFVTLSHGEKKVLRNTVQYSANICYLVLTI